MTGIFLLAFAAAVFPLLIASVAILISRPRPRRLLLAFYAGGITASVICGLLVLIVFDKGDSVAGNTPSAPQPAVSLVEGAVAMFLAWLMVTPSGKRALERVRARFSRSRNTAPEPEPRPASQAEGASGPSWVERRLDGSLIMIFAVGAVINLPGPFYLLALGRISEGAYTTVGKVLLIVAFNLIMFLLLEVPLVAYAIAPERTARQVRVAGDWLTANGLRVTGGFIGLYGLVLVVQGLLALL